VDFHECPTKKSRHGEVVPERDDEGKAAWQTVVSVMRSDEVAGFDFNDEPGNTSEERRFAESVNEGRRVHCLRTSKKYTGGIQVRYSCGETKEKRV